MFKSSRLNSWAISEFVIPCCDRVIGSIDRNSMMFVLGGKREEWVYAF